MAAAGGDNILSTRVESKRCPWVSGMSVSIDPSKLFQERHYIIVYLVYVETHEAWRKSKDLNSKDATL